MDLIEVTKQMENHPKVVRGRRACIILGVLIPVAIFAVSAYAASVDGTDIEQMLGPSIMMTVFIWPLIMSFPLYSHHVTRNRIYEMIKADYEKKEFDNVSDVAASYSSDDHEQFPQPQSGTMQNSNGNDKYVELLSRIEENKRQTEDLMNTFMERKRLYEEGNLDVVDENGSIVTEEMQEQYDKLIAGSKELHRLHDIYHSEEPIKNGAYVYQQQSSAPSTNASDKIAKGLMDIGASYMLGKAAMKAMDSIINIPKENPNTARYAQACKEAQERHEQQLNSRKPTINNVVLSNGRSGKLESRVNGTQILKDAGGRTIARYDSSSKKTYGDGFNVIGNGNCISQYISHIKD